MGRFAALLCIGLPPLGQVFAQPASYFPPSGGGHDGMGNGIAKSTHACSEKVATSARAWMEKYMPLTDATDDCKDHTCTCGIQSRVETKSDFGLHCTYAYGKDHSRENANGGITLEEIEGVFTSKLGDWSSYETDANVRAWSDYHTQFYKQGGLDSMVAAFQKDGVKFHSGSWTESSKTFYSILFQVPDSQVIAEVWSDSCSTCGSSVFAETRQRDASTLSSKASSGDFFATQVSRAVEDLSIITDFYSHAFSKSPSSTNTLSDDSEYVDFNFGTEVDIRYFKRAGQSGTQTTSWFQSKLVNASTTYMTSVSSCWPIWGDNHYAYDGPYKTQTVLDGAKSSTFGCYFKPVSAGMGQAYMLEPSGWQIQLDGQYTAPSGTENFDPEYCSTSCLSSAAPSQSLTPSEDLLPSLGHALAQPSDYFPPSGGGHDGMGNGIAKSTHACSEKVATSARSWMEKYMPLTDADDDCTDHTCKCGIQSRVETKSDFGLHCTYAYGKDHSRENANGGITLEEIEGVFTSKIGDWSAYESDANVRAWSDYHTQFYKQGGLDSMVAAFQKDGVKFYSGSWTESSKTFYSILFQVPDSQVIVEVWSDSCSTCGSSVFAETRQRDASTLSAKASSGDFFATQVSRAVEDLSIITDFYSHAFSKSPSSTNTLSDGSEYVDFNFGTEVDIRYFKRAGQSGTQTTSWFQSKLVNASKTYMTGVTSCWPIWGDNHFAYDGSYKTQTVLDGAKSSTFGSYFKPVSAGPMTQAYMLEPSGWQIQLDGTYTAPSGTEGFDPEYCSTSCLTSASSSPSFTRSEDVLV